jgi:hypothetical protein
VDLAAAMVTVVFDEGRVPLAKTPVAQLHAPPATPRRS